MPEIKKDITVVIASSEDEAVFDCINSVRGEANVAVSLTPYKPIENRLAQLGIPYTIVPRGNLGLTYNRGIELAQTNKVIVMTDDATFTSGAIGRLSEGLDQHDACKARIAFQTDGSKLSQVVADVRDFINSSPTRVFTPGLAMRKDIKDRMGGHFFDEQVRWAEDAEFSYRFHKKGLNFDYIREAVIQHPSVSVNHDLKGAFLIGLSKRRAVDLGLRQGNEDVLPTLQRVLSGVTFDRKYRLFREKGPSALLYMLVWDSFYNLGYNLRKAGLSAPIENRIWQGFGRGNSVTEP